MRVFDNFDLTKYNSYRLRAFCRTAFFPENDEDIAFLFQAQETRKIVLGGGYNILLSKENYDRDFIIFADTFSKIELIGEDCLLVEAGCDMKKLSEFALGHNLTGLEIFYDIPSSLGGAVVMNAGAGGEDIQQILLRVDYYDPSASVFTQIKREDIGFEYRNSFFQRNPQMIICRALLQLKKGDHYLINEKMQAVKTTRWIKQPREYPNAGSVFKRPPGRFVGPMIDELGLKGYTVGGAKISEKHSGFIVNFNHAKGTDIMSIIDLVKAKVAEKFNVELEVEQRII